MLFVTGCSRADILGNIAVIRHVLRFRRNLTTALPGDYFFLPSALRNEVTLLGILNCYIFVLVRWAFLIIFHKCI